MIYKGFELLEDVVLDNQLRTSVVPRFYAQAKSPCGCVLTCVSRDNIEDARKTLIETIDGGAPCPNCKGKAE